MEIRIDEKGPRDPRTIVDEALKQASLVDLEGPSRVRGLKEMRAYLAAA